MNLRNLNKYYYIKVILYRLLRYSSSRPKRARDEFVNVYSIYRRIILLLLREPDKAVW